MTLQPAPKLTQQAIEPFDPIEPTKTGLLIRMGIYVLLAVTSLILFASILYFLVDTLASAVLSVLFSAALTNAVTIRVFERAGPSAIGFGRGQHWLRHFAIGTVLAAAAGGAIVLLPVLAGLAKWEPTKLATVSWQGFLYTTFMLALGVIAEELYFRGYGFQVALPVAGPWGALIPMALLFAYVHTGNLNSSALSFLNTFAWGVLLGYAVLRSGDLWLAIGMHAGWNWILPILGVNLSGFTMKLTGYDVIWALPDAWSGGAYGPEGGLICTLVVPVLALVLWKLPLRTQPLALLRRPA